MTAGYDRRRLHAVVAAVVLAALPLVLAAAPSPAATQQAPAAGGSPAAAADVTGLAVELTAVTPSALEPGEPLELQGRVTNVDDHQWGQVRAYLVISPSPLTTVPELAAAADSPPESYFGDRVVDLGLFARLRGLTPSEVAPFRLSVPWRNLDISAAPGVYTVGVQVLATDLDGSRPTEGRARTFVPLVDETAAASVRTALVWPLDGVLLRRSDGTYARAGRTTRAMAPDGRLGRMVDLGRTAGSVPLTVVPDPALLDAAADLGSGSFGPPGGDPALRPDPGGLAAVASWFGDTLELLSASTPWLTGYGEPAADTLAAADRPALTASVAAAGQAVRQQLLTGQERTLHLPAGGIVDPGTLGWLRGPDGVAAAALAPQMLPDREPLDGSTFTVPTDTGPLDVLVADPDLAAGGPAPGDRQSALQVRQRLLAETALLSLDTAAAGRGSTSAAFVAPQRWDPGPDWPVAGFFAGLDVPWLEPVPLDVLLASPRPYAGRAGVPAAAAAPGESRVELLPASLVTAAAELDVRVRVFAKLVSGAPPLTRWYDATVALAVSEAGLQESATRQRQTERSTASVRRALRDVTVTGPEFVTLSSSAGRFPLTVTNRLDRTVTVSVRILSADAEPVAGTRFDTGGTLTLRPGASDTVTVQTRVGRAGVTSARAHLVTENGRRFGTPLAFRVRTSVVGTVIWVIMGVACAVLAFAIVRRLVRGARSAGRAGTRSSRRASVGSGR